MQENDGGYDVLIEIDALLDTRLGAIARLDPDAASKVFDDFRYYTRETDDFLEVTGLTREVTDKAYKERDEETLAASLITPMIYQLAEIVKSIQVDFAVRRMSQPFRVLINGYPYKDLRKDERTAICMAVKNHLNLDVPVEMVFMTPEEVSPSYIRANLSGMILYNFNAWMAANFNALEKVAFPRVHVVAPRLFEKETPAPELRQVKEFNNASPFGILKFGLSMYFTLIFMHPSFFSVVPPLTLRHKLPQEVKASQESDAIMPPEGLLQDSEDVSSPETP
ncbi:MAG TPA: hypothetical protein VN081_02455 [Dongiaceae bacterium]|nr:hypothetical protein [Dongiaceae bacterium]